MTNPRGVAAVTIVLLLLGAAQASPPMVEAQASAVARAGRKSDRQSAPPRATDASSDTSQRAEANGPAIAEGASQLLVSPAARADSAALLGSPDARRSQDVFLRSGSPSRETGDDELRWRNSVVTSAVDLNTTALGDADRTYNPTFVGSLSLRPRWYLTDTAFIGLRQDVTLELTDSDCAAAYSTCRTRNREPFLNDLSVTLFENQVLSHDRFALAAGATVGAPTSIASLNRGMIFSLGPVLRGTLTVPEVLAGLVFQLVGSYSYTVGGNAVSDSGATYRNQLAATSRSDLAALAAQGEAFVIGAPSPSSHAGNVTILGLLNPTEDVTVLLSFSWLWRQPSGDAGPFVVDGVLTSPMGLEVPARDNVFRLFTVFGLSLGYNLASWINVAINYTHFTGEFAPDGGRRNPFWSEDSTVGLSATLTLDQLYLNLSQGNDEGNPLRNMVSQIGLPRPAF